MAVTCDLSCTVAVCQVAYWNKLDGVTIIMRLTACSKIQTWSYDPESQRKLSLSSDFRSIWTSWLECSSQTKDVKADDEMSPSSLPHWSDRNGFSDEKRWRISEFEMLMKMRNIPERKETTRFRVTFTLVKTWWIQVNLGSPFVGILRRGLWHTLSKSGWDPCAKCCSWELRSGWRWLDLDLFAEQHSPSCSIPKSFHVF